MLHYLTTLPTSLALHLLTLVNRYSSTGGVKSSSSPSMCPGLSCKMDTICSLTLCFTKPWALQTSLFQLLPPMLTSSPSSFSTQHLNEGTHWHWQCTWLKDWMEILLLALHCLFCGNRSEGHLTVTLQANTYKSNWNEMVWIRWLHSRFGRSFVEICETLKFYSYY